MDMDKKYLIIKGKGPILITGTHVVNTLRKKYELHHQEKYIFNIITKLYKKLGPKRCTLITWDVKKIKKEKNILPQDPNYIQQNSYCLWAEEIKKILKKRVIDLHLDFHGMKNNSTPNDIDIGIGVNLKKLTQSHYEKVKKIIVNNIRQINKKSKISTKFIGNGYGKYETITKRTRRMGIFSIQFEISQSFRKKLNKSKVKIKKLSEIILDIEKNLIKIIKKTKKHRKKVKRFRTLKCK
tara:strand:+ start:12772 stop:13488 length:717 start_codon:yes stop_codon:yes gene_type:complete